MKIYIYRINFNLYTYKWISSYCLETHRKSVATLSSEKNKKKREGKFVIYLSIIVYLFSLNFSKL